MSQNILHSNIISSYNGYYNNDVINFVDKAISNIPSNVQSQGELKDWFNDKLADVDISVSDGNDGWGEWSYTHVKSGSTNSYGEINVEVDLASLFEDVEQGYKGDWMEFVMEFKSTIAHELTHRYRFEQTNAYHLNDYSDYDEDKYLLNKTEMAARVSAAVEELMNVGYTKERLLEKMSTNEGFTEMLNESNQTSRYPSLINPEYRSDKDDWRYLQKIFYNEIMKR